MDSEPELNNFLPFTSRDIDFAGNREDVQRIAAQLGIPLKAVKFPHEVEMTALAGLILFRIRTAQSNIEIVRSVIGVKPSWIETYAIEAERMGERSE